MTLTALAVTVVLSLLGQRWLRRRLSSLAEFERADAATSRVLERNQRIEGDWGVVEVDTLASTLNDLLEADPARSRTRATTSSPTPRTSCAAR